MTPYPKLSCVGGLLLAVFVALATARSVVQASSGLTLPNITFISFNLAPGASSGPVFPISDTAVKVGGVVNHAVFGSTGFVVLLHPSASPNFLQWFGLESASGSFTPVPTSGFSSTAGNHIVYLDQSRLVDIENAPSPNSAHAFVVKNSSGSVINPATGWVSLIW